MRSFLPFPLLPYEDLFQTPRPFLFSKLVLETPGKKKLDARKHDTKEFRYASSDSSVATVNKNGKIKAVGKGKCDIWIYAINGCGSKVSIVVK